MERFPRPPANEKSPQEQYARLLDAYYAKAGELKKLQRRSPRGVVDNDIASAIQIIDQERHETHLKLIEIGQKLGKKKEDVLVDIIRKDGTLEEYGLPEFSILKDDDIIDTEDWHNGYYYNVDTKLRRPSTETLTDPYGREGKKVLQKDECMIVFAIVPIIEYGEIDEDPEDYPERVARAEQLAAQVGGKMFERRNSGYHEAYAKILGVTIPKKELEAVASTIRNSPQKYRLGKEFYSEEQRASMQLRQANAFFDLVLRSDPINALPERLPGSEILKETKVLLVDDDEDVFASFVPHLIVATEGNSAFLPHWGQDMDQLLEGIQAEHPGLILMDYHLSHGIEGSDVAKKLIEQGFAGAIIGFSSDKKADQAFKQAGALGAIDKKTDAPVTSMKELLRVLGAEQK